MKSRAFAAVRRKQRNESLTSITIVHDHSYGKYTRKIHLRCNHGVGANLLFSTSGTPARLTSIAAAVFAPCKT